MASGQTSYDEQSSDDGLPELHNLVVRAAQSLIDPTTLSSSPNGIMMDNQGKTPLQGEKRIIRLRKLNHAQPANHVLRGQWDTGVPSKSSSTGHSVVEQGRTKAQSRRLRPNKHSIPPGANHWGTDEISMEKNSCYQSDSSEFICESDIESESNSPSIFATSGSPSKRQASQPSRTRSLKESSLVRHETTDGQDKCHGTALSSDADGHLAPHFPPLSFEFVSNANTSYQSEPHDYGEKPSKSKQGSRSTQHYR
jgi:hypothetical protein